MLPFVLFDKKSALFIKNDSIIRYFWVTHHQKCPFQRFPMLPLNSRLHSSQTTLGEGCNLKKIKSNLCNILPLYNIYWNQSIHLMVFNQVKLEQPLLSANTLLAYFVNFAAENFNIKYYLHPIFWIFEILW